MGWQRVRHDWVTFTFTVWCPVSGKFSSSLPQWLLQFLCDPGFEAWHEWKYLTTWVLLFLGLWFSMSPEPLRNQEIVFFFCHQKHNSPYKAEYSLPHSPRVEIIGHLGFWSVALGALLSGEKNTGVWWWQVICISFLTTMVEMFFLLTHLRLQGEGKKEKERSKFVLSNQKSRKKSCWKCQGDQAGLETQAEGQDIAVRPCLDFLSLLNATLATSECFLHVRVVMLTLETDLAKTEISL